MWLFPISISTRWKAPRLLSSFWIYLSWLEWEWVCSTIPNTLACHLFILSLPLLCSLHYLNLHVWIETWRTILWNACHCVLSKLINQLSWEETSHLIIGIQLCKTKRKFGIKYRMDGENVEKTLIVLAPYTIVLKNARCIIRSTMRIKY